MSLENFYNFEPANSAEKSSAKIQVFKNILLLFFISILIKIPEASAQEAPSNLSELYDICELDNNARMIIQERYTALGNDIEVYPSNGEEIALVDFYRSGMLEPEVINTGAEANENIEGAVIGEIDNEKYNIILMPTGYEDSERMETDLIQIKNHAELVWGELPLNIVGLNESFPLTLTGVEDYLYPSNVEVYEHIDAVDIGIDENTRYKIVVVYDSERPIGSGGFVPLISGHNEYTPFLFDHEAIGHSIGRFNDGGRRQYILPEVEGSTEFIIPGTGSDQRIEEAIEELDFEIDMIPDYRCGSVPVYKINEAGVRHRNLMRGILYTEDIENRGMDILNEPQQLVLRQTLEQLLEDNNTN